MKLRSKAGTALAVKCNVLDKKQIEDAAKEITAKLGKVDILINGAGGNKKDATTSDSMTFFDLPAEAIRGVFDLNFLGTLLPSQVFGKDMAKNGSGVILNVSSMNALQAIDEDLRVFGCEGGGEQFYAVVSGAYQSELLEGYTGQRDCAGVFPDGAEQVFADR